MSALGKGMLAVLPVAAMLAQVRDIPFDSALQLKMPPQIHLGEVAGAASTSKGNIVVYTRTGETAEMGGSRTFTHGGSRLFEFSPAGLYLREIGVGVYGFLFAQAVRVDPSDNIWVVDRGSNMVIKFDPAGRIVMTMSRKPESISPGGGGPPAGGRGAAAPAAGAAGGGGGGGRGAGRGLPGAGIPGDNFNRPADLAWDAAGNIFVADGYGNSRVAKFDKNGKFLKSWGSRGTETSQFDSVRSIAVDGRGDVYVADYGNRRIQVFDNEGVFKTQITHPGAPWTICISPGPHQYLFSSNSNQPDAMDNGEIYKMELDGKVLGKFGTAGKLNKEFGTVSQIDCRNPNVLYVGELTNWRVQRISLKP